MKEVVTDAFTVLFQDNEIEFQENEFEKRLTQFFLFIHTFTSNISL